MLKVWVALQRLGVDGVGALYDHLHVTTLTLHDRLDANEVVHTPESNILCWKLEGAEDRTAQLAREEFNGSGEGWISTTSLNGGRLLRVTVMNPRTEVIAIHDSIRRQRAVAQSRRPEFRAT